MDDEFKNIDTYSQFKQYRRNKYHSPVYVYKKRQQFQADNIKFTDQYMLEATGNVANL